MERGYSIIVWQEQVVRLIEDVAGFTVAEAAEVRRAFARANSKNLVQLKPSSYDRRLSIPD